MTGAVDEPDDLYALFMSPVEDEVALESTHPPRPNALGTRRPELPQPTGPGVLEQQPECLLNRVEQALGGRWGVGTDMEVGLGEILLRQASPDDPPSGPAEAPRAFAEGCS